MRSPRPRASLAAPASYAALAALAAALLLAAPAQAQGGVQPLLASLEEGLEAQQDAAILLGEALRGALLDGARGGAADLDQALALADGLAGEERPGARAAELALDLAQDPAGAAAGLQADADARLLWAANHAQACLLGHAALAAAFVEQETGLGAGPLVQALAVQCRHAQAHLADPAATLALLAPQLPGL